MKMTRWMISQNFVHFYCCLVVLITSFLECQVNGRTILIDNWSIPKSTTSATTKSWELPLSELYLLVRVGDTLIWNWPQKSIATATATTTTLHHNVVYRPSGSCFDDQGKSSLQVSTMASEDGKSYASAEYTFVPEDEGKILFFACDIDDYCSLGMQLSVIVEGQACASIINNDRDVDKDDTVEDENDDDAFDADCLNVPVLAPTVIEFSTLDIPMPTMDPTMSSASQSVTPPPSNIPSALSETGEPTNVPTHISTLMPSTGVPTFRPTTTSPTIEDFIEQTDQPFIDLPMNGGEPMPTNMPTFINTGIPSSTPTSNSPQLDSVLTDVPSSTNIPTSHNFSFQPSSIRNGDTSRPEDDESNMPTISGEDLETLIVPSANPTILQTTAQDIIKLVQSSITMSVIIFGGRSDNVPFEAYGSELVDSVLELVEDEIISDFEDSWELSRRSRQLVKKRRSKEDVGILVIRRRLEDLDDSISARIVDVSSLTFTNSPNVNSLDLFVSGDCPINFTADRLSDTCQEIRIDVDLMVNSMTYNVDKIMQEFPQALENSLRSGQIQFYLKNNYPDSRLSIINGQVVNNLDINGNIQGFDNNSSMAIQGDDDELSTTLIIGIICASIASLVFLALLLLMRARRRNLQSNEIATESSRLALYDN